MARTNGWRIVAMAAAVGACSAVVASAQPSLVLHVDDQAGVPPHELAAAKVVVERTFSAAGVEIAWTEGRFPMSILGPTPGRDAESTQVDAGPARHLAVVLTISGERSTRGAAGCALGFAATRLPVAYAFYNRIVEASRNRPVDLTVVLGRVIAHEIGHLLLPPDSHATHGIMRPDLDFDVRNPDRFTDDQTHALRTALVTRSAGR